MSLDATLQKLASGASAWKEPVRVVATTNITRVGLQTIDGVALSEGDRVLLAGQTDAKQNGIFLAKGSAWTRALDLDRSTYLRLGMAVLVRSGTANEGSLWTLTAPTTGTPKLDSDELEFSKYTAVVEGDIAVDSLTADLVTTDLVETGAITNAAGVVAITGGGGGVTINHGGLAFTLSLSGNVARMVGSGSSGLLLSTGAGAATISGATGVALQYNGGANFSATLASNVSTFTGAGSSGTLIATSAGPITVHPLNGQFLNLDSTQGTRVRNNDGSATYVTIDSTGLTATGLIAPTLQHGGNIGILAPSYIYLRSAGGVFLDGQVDFRDATGATTRASIAGTGALTLPVIAAASVATPAAGSKTVFFDASNSDKFSSKNSSGTVTVIGTET